MNEQSNFSIAGYSEIVGGKIMPISGKTKGNPSMNEQDATVPETLETDSLLGAIMQLRSSIGAVEEISEELRKRLEPVLLPDTVTEEKSPDPVSSNASLLRVAIEIENERIQGIAQSLLETLNRLEALKE